MISIQSRYLHPQCKCLQKREREQVKKRQDLTASEKRVWLLAQWSIQYKKAVIASAMTEYLSNYSVVAIYYTRQEQRHFFTSKSLIKNKIFLSQESASKDFENSLFFIEIDGNKLEFNVPIQYDTPVAFRHKISQKYLTLAVDEEEEKEIRYKLVLGNEKKHFKIKPCYQYQTKISTRIKFNEEIYLSTEYTQSRHGLITTELSSGTTQLYLGFNFGSKFQFHLYTLYEKQQKYYKHGKIVWISHIESDNFLSLQTINTKDEIVFEPIKYDKQIQNLSALWSIESNNLTESRYLKYDEQIRFKNLFTGSYLAFSKNYKLVDNERIYQIYLEEGMGDYSRFVFKSIHEKQAKQFEKNAYLSLQHYESNLFIGCRKEKVNLTCFKLLTFPYMQDEDLFKINEFSLEEEQALRFIFAIRKEFKEIAMIIRKPSREITMTQMQEIEQTYANIMREFNSLKKFEKLFDFVRNELGRSIQFIAENLNFFRNLSEAPQSTPTSRSSRLHTVSNKILVLSYQIVCIFCVNHAGNQSISFKYMVNYLNDIGTGVGAEEVFMETLRNNNELLPKINLPLGKEGNIVRMILMEFRKKNKERDYLYWKNLMKIIQIISVMLFHNGNTLDMNQYIISEELFKNGLYELIFLPIHVQGERIMLFDSESDKFLPIEQINKTQLNEVVDAIFDMFSNLTNNHSFNSKQYIHNYFAARNHACLTVFITYLNKPIRKQLYNKIINFLAKTYLDSSPRLKRHKPLSFVFFNFEEEKSNIEQEEAYYSSRLREMLMLKAEESSVCKPLHYSNLLKLTDSAEPSMSEEQLVTFRLNLTEKILNSSDCSSEQLETVSLLMKLESYTVNEMLQIYEQLKTKLILGDISPKLIAKILEIIEQMFMLMQELELKKMRIYLQHKFLNKKEQQELKEDQYKFILPLSTRIFIPFDQKEKKSQDLNRNQSDYIDVTGKNPTVLHKEVKDYNELRDTLALMHASPQMRKALMEHFCNYKQNELSEAEACNYLSSIFNLILQSNLPKYKFLKLLSKSTILTHDEIGQFDHLFDITKKLQYLILISEFWMVGESEPDNVRLFLKYLNEMTNYMFDDFAVGGGEQNFQRNIEELNIKKQLLIGSLGVHNLVFELLQKNYYLLENAQSRKELKKKYKQIFEACFVFIYYLIRHCGQNKRIIYEYFSILLMYQPTLQLGQIRTYIEFYRDQKDFVKEINFTFIENIIHKIIKRASIEGKNDSCEFNPEYVDFLIVLIESLDIEGKFFIEKLYNFLSKENILQQILFLDDSAKKKKENRLCLLMRKMKIQPVQIPIIYHTKLLKLFNFILSSSSETIRNSFRIKLGQIFKVNYLIEILNEPDIYSHFGIEPKLKFILKKEVNIFLQTLLDKSEFHTQIYESEEVMKLLQCYSRVLTGKIDKKEMSSESQSLYLPYMEEYAEYLETYLNNKNLYYEDQVKPFLNKLTIIFDKQPRAEDTTIKDYLESLQEELRKQMKTEITKRTTTFSHAYGLKDMKLKWRNFVDDDQDNSKQEKYAKKTILDILKSKKAEKIIEEELSHFYDLVKENSKLFINSMIKLLTILFNTKNIEDGRKKQSKTIQKTLKYLSGYLTHITDQKQIKLIIQILQTNKFIEIFIDLTTKKQFQLTKMHLKNIFYYCLKILNFLLDKDTSDFKFNKLLYKIFKQHHLSYKFLEFLKQGAVEILSTIDSNNYYEQINSSLEQMYLCVDDVPLHLYEETYRTLTYLCKYEPFTDYLRSQQSFNEIDFLDKIYNIFTFLYSDQKGMNKAIKMSSVRATEYILDFVSSILTGGNKANQGYIIDSKYGRFINSVLKIESLQPVTAQRNIRQELLDKIIEFYKSNGIQISELLHSKIKLIDFKHTYLLNRFKYILIKTLLECLIANPNNIAKIKLQIPLQIIKLNFIWIYEFYKNNKYEYEEKFILREREDWMKVVVNEKDIETLYLRLGFYYYQLIQLYEEAEDASGHTDHIENDEKIINEEKEKERVVKKFFRTIQQKQRKESMVQSLTDEKLEEQMKRCYHVYYNALLFFEKHTGKIEVNLKDEILTVYFPILPLAQRITKQMEEEFKQGAVRLSRDQKIKSLMQYQNTFYEDLKGEDDYFTEIENKMPMFGPVLRMMKYESEFLLVAWIANIIMCLTYLIENYQDPSQDFHHDFFHFITPVAHNPLMTIMLILSLTDLIIGLSIGIYLFTRKIPLMKKLLSIKYAKMDQQNKVGIMNSQFAFVWSNIFRKTFYNLYVVLFLLLVVVHPFFASFILIEIINRIEMGRFIIRSIKQTWFQLLVAVGLLLVFNFVFSQLIYDFFTSASGYGPICSSQFVCLLLLTDQNFKGGAGAMGNVTSDYVNMIFNMQVLAQILNIIFGLKVISEIFSGTIIDKFSELRQEEQGIAQDENTICFICGQERFDLDLQYQGFDVHIEKNHNVLNYMYYMFYLRRCSPREYGIIERYIHQCKFKASEEWIPEMNSVSKQEKERKDKEMEKEDFKKRHSQYWQVKLKEMKRFHQKMEIMIKDMKDITKESKQPTLPVQND